MARTQMHYNRQNAHCRLKGANIRVYNFFVSGPKFTKFLMCHNVVKQLQGSNGSGPYQSQQNRNDLGALLKKLTEPTAHMSTGS